MKEKYIILDYYKEGLKLLDDYDHNSLEKPDFEEANVNKLTLEESRDLIENMNEFNSDVFGKEKEKGKLNGILEAVYQNVYGEYVYSTNQEKAANLLYFLIKDHPFSDGCKRIGASLFLHFLYKNNLLLKDEQLIISNHTLVTLVLLIAESKVEEKELMIKIIMNILNK